MGDQIVHPWGRVEYSLTPYVHVCYKEVDLGAVDAEQVSVWGSNDRRAIFMEWRVSQRDVNI